MVEEMISSPGAFIFSVYKNKCNGAELRSVRPNRAESSALSFSRIEGEPKASTTSSLPGRIQVLLLELLERNAPCEPFDSYFVFWHSLSFRRRLCRRKLLHRKKSPSPASLLVSWPSAARLQAGQSSSSTESRWKGRRCAPLKSLVHSKNWKS